MEWFYSLALFTQIYWGIALIGSFIFVITIVTTFIGGDSGDLDTDAEIEADTGIGFQFITFKNLVGFFTLFGWSGIACIDAGFSKPITITVSLKMKNAIGSVGEVYLTIGAKRSTIGKAHVRVQGALRELEALTDSETDLKSGSVISVKEVTTNGILIVEQLNK